MPPRSLTAAPDEVLKDENKQLKEKVSALGNENSRLGKELGQAQKDQKALASLKEAHKGLEARLSASQAEVSRLEADLVSARAGGSRDAETLAAAKQVAEGLKKLA